MVLIGAVIGLTLGGIGGYVFHRPPATTTLTPAQALHQGQTEGARKTNTKAADARVRWNGWLTASVTLATDAMQSANDKRGDLTQLQSALDANSQAMATEVGGYYGATARSQYLGFIQGQNLSLTDYAAAVRDHDSAKQTDAATALRTLPVTISAFLQTLNPNLLRTATSPSLAQINAALMAGLDAYASGNFTTAVSQRSKAEALAGRLADNLSAGIVKQFPTKF